MDTLLKISTVIRYKKIGIVVVRKGTSDYDISYYQMLKKGSAVDICRSQENLTSFDQIESNGEKIPTIISIHGIGLVQRMMKGLLSDISQNIPNINADEYLIATDQTNQEEKLVALCRKEQIESILSENTLHQLPICGISLGFTDLGKYIQLLQIPTNTFEFGGSIAHIQDKRINDIKKEGKDTTAEYLFAGQKRKASQIIALTAGLSYFTAKNQDTFDITAISENIKELTASRLSTIILYYLGTALFILLLINFILFDHYNSKETQLQEEYQGIANLQNEITQLQSELKVKKQFIEQSNVPENYAFAFYADRLACCAHDGISFSEVAICPVLGKVKKDKVIGFYNNTLHVVGTALNSTTFSIFLEKINQSAWIKKINKQVYVFDNENDNAAFELEIILNDATD